METNLCTMTFDQILLLGSIVIPALASIFLFAGMGRNEFFAKNLAYLGFGFPFLAGIIQSRTCLERCKILPIFAHLGIRL